MTTMNLASPPPPVITAVEKIKAVTESWDLSPVRKYLAFNEGVPTETTLLMENEYKKFMSVIIGEQLYSQMPISPMVDEFWHAHILFTRDYTDFCQATAGCYIHHNPTSSAAEREDLASAYEQVTLPRLTHYFGESNELLWPEKAPVCLGCGTTK